MTVYDNCWTVKPNSITEHRSPQNKRKKGSEEKAFLPSFVSGCWLECVVDRINRPSYIYSGF